jgi:hypothetical protein
MIEIELIAFSECETLAAPRYHPANRAGQSVSRCGQSFLTRLRIYFRVHA